MKIDRTDPRYVHAVALAADVDPRTVKKYLEGEEVRARLVRRIDEAIRAFDAEARKKA